MGLTEAYYEFFIELALNNQKSWFDVNRARYEADVKKPFLAFVTQLLDKVAAMDPRFAGIDAKSCIFRINKDIRFSKDKTPYKLHCSAAIQLGGRKEMSAGGMYLEFGPEHCGIYSGIYMPEREALQLIRERIAGNLEGFAGVIGASDMPSASLTSCWLRISNVTDIQAWGIWACGNLSCRRAHKALFTPEKVRVLG